MDKKTAICQYLKKYHTGGERAVYSRELQRLFSIDGRGLRRKINSLRQDGYPICSDERGYYYADSQDEINGTVCRLNQMVTKVSNARTGLLYASIQDSGITVEVSVTVEKLFKISMQGTLTYKVGLGTDVFGNIQRMDNLLESMPTRQLDYKEKLKNLEIQVEIAKQEVEKPFPREEELKAKSARLDQLNILLNMDKRENEIVDGVQDEGEIQPQRESRGWDR